MDSGLSLKSGLKKRSTFQLHAMDSIGGLRQVLVAEVNPFNSMQWIRHRHGQLGCHSREDTFNSMQWILVRVVHHGSVTPVVAFQLHAMDSWPARA